MAVKPSSTTGTVAPDVFQLEDVERPDTRERRGPGRIPFLDREPDGLRLAQGKPLFARFFTGLRRPKRRILGSELRPDEVAAVGTAVTEFEVGDWVFGASGFDAHAEFTCEPESSATGRTFPPA